MKIYLIGIGTGRVQDLTVKAYDLIKKARYLVGAKRMLEVAEDSQAEVFCSYNPEEIAEYFDKLDSNPEDYAAVLLSGDVSFFSGAKKLRKALKNHEVGLISGISSVAYLAAKLQISYEAARLTSVHGRDKNIIAAVRDNKETFSLLEGLESVIHICDKIEYYLPQVHISVGCDLGYDTELIIDGDVAQVRERLKKEAVGCKLFVAYFRNEAAKARACFQIKDEEFIRETGEGKLVPMTKQEIRTISLSKLDLKKDSVLYDIGAGTGSISIEAALKSEDIKVFAIEKNASALELIEKNIRHFAADNVVPIRGLAPEAFEGLEAPSHAFIGGSSGAMKEILDNLYRINPKVKIVINAISLDTVMAVRAYFQDKACHQLKTTMLQVSWSKEIGENTLMMGDNPVYIFEVD